MPRITHLQFLVLGCLLEEARAGREIRAALHEHGVKKSGPAFYQAMARMEDAGFVTGSYDSKVVDGQMIKQRRYEITTAGAGAWRESRDFYLSAIKAFDPRRGFARV